MKLESMVHRLRLTGERRSSKKEWPLVRKNATRPFRFNSLDSSSSSSTSRSISHAISHLPRLDRPSKGNVPVVLLIPSVALEELLPTSWRVVSLLVVVAKSWAKKTNRCCRSVSSNIEAARFEETESSEVVGGEERTNDHSQTGLGPRQRASRELRCGSWREASCRLSRRPRFRLLIAICGRGGGGRGRGGVRTRLRKGEGTRKDRITEEVRIRHQG